jgi:hypothetical protein
MRARPLGRSEGILVEELGDGVVIYDSATHEAHSLDGAATRVWRAADGTRTLEEIAEIAGLDEFGTVAALEELTARGLMAEQQPAISRRKMLRRGALVGAVVAAVPVIETVVIPTAAAHASTGRPSPI